MNKKIAVLSRNLSKRILKVLARLMFVCVIKIHTHIKFIKKDTKQQIYLSGVNLIIFV